MDFIARLEIVAGERLRISIRLVATKFQSLKMEATLVSSTVKAGSKLISFIKSFNCWNSISISVSAITTLISSRTMWRLLISFGS